MKAHGIHNYSIFYHAKTNQLFGYLEIEDEEKLEKMAENDVCKKWWPLHEKFPRFRKARRPESQRRGNAAGLSHGLSQIRSGVSIPSRASPCFSTLAIMLPSRTRLSRIFSGAFKKGTF